MPSELRVRVSGCQAGRAAARLCAPDSLRPHGRAEAPSRRPGTARSRPGRRATGHASGTDHARLARRPGRDSPPGGRRDGAYPRSLLVGRAGPVWPSRRPARPARALFSPEGRRGEHSAISGFAAFGARPCGRLAGGALWIRAGHTAGPKRRLVDLAQPRSRPSWRATRVALRLWNAVCPRWRFRSFAGYALGLVNFQVPVPRPRSL